MASPSVHSSPNEALVDPFKAGDYPIFLGESLKGAAGAKRRLVNFRYNWKPKDAGSKHEAVVTRNAQRPDQYQISIKTSTDKSYRYSGRVASKQTSTEDQHGDLDSLTLIYDRTQSAFILESISASLDFNLVAAPELNREAIDALTKLSAGSPRSDPDAHNSDQEQTDVGGGRPEAANPYDYRHFLIEARENLDKAATNGSRTPIPGNLTPIAGNRTPISGVSSPIPGASRFLGSNTKPAAGSANFTSAPAQKKRKANEKINATQTTKLNRTQPKPKPNPKSNAAPSLLSKDTISSPSSDGNNMRRTTLHAPSNPHAVQISSPHIVVDDPSGLEIDLGSPPPEPSRRRHQIDPSAFRSHVGSTTTNNTKHVIQRDSDGDVDMEDDDVDALELGSPRTAAGSNTAPSSSHVEQAVFSTQHTQDEEDDEDDELAAELEAALEEDEDDEDEGEVGLGIHAATGVRADEEESEISEEE